MTCECCGSDAIYRCGVCGRLLCGEHSRLRAVCLSCIEEKPLEYVVGKLDSDEERARIRELVQRFWGEEEQLAFEREFLVAELPAYVAKTDSDVVGFISYAEVEDVLIAMA